MAIYRLQCSLQDKSQLPRDQYVTTIHVASQLAAATPDELGFGLTAFFQFFDRTLSRLSPTIAGSGHTVKAYLVGAPLHDPPVAHQDQAFSAAPAGNPMPNEVATCLTFHAARVAGVPPQSTRGRIYIGPLDDSNMVGDAAGSPVIATTALNNFVTSAQTMATALRAQNLTWCVFSKTRHLAYPVRTVSMDNEWDTVRSRGKRATFNQVEPLTSQPPADGPIAP